jgi:hypothetical protein
MPQLVACLSSNMKAWVQAPVPWKQNKNKILDYLSIFRDGPSIAQVYTNNWFHSDFGPHLFFLFQALSVTFFLRCH